MGHEPYINLCIYHVLDGLRHGLSHFSPPSRAALIYVNDRNAPPRIYDPQNLLLGHGLKLEQFFLETALWREKSRCPKHVRVLEHDKNDVLDLAGIVSFGGHSHALCYQMWFTEEHPDMCSTGPTERWLEHAAWLLSQDIASNNPLYIGTSGLVLQNCATHAVRDFLVDRRGELMGVDTRLRIYPVLDAILSISKTREEGAWARGRLVFVDPSKLGEVDFLACFPEQERPSLKNHKHVRKLLLSVEHCARFLVSDGVHIVGIARSGTIPCCSVVADFRGEYGFVLLDAMPVCSFSDGMFHSSTRKAKLVQVEEILLETDLVPERRTSLFQIVSDIVHNAEEKKFGATLVLDLNSPPHHIPGQHLDTTLDLRVQENREFAKSLSRVDGALHIGADLGLHGFACLLDGHAVKSENRARGARFNSALRFTSEHANMIIIVVSSDRPVSVIQGGVELTAQCEWQPMFSCVETPPTLQEWLETIE
ncbi:DNA integrity scanning protein DisA nucleotide-binding domain protein [Desulfoplanes sp.]